MGGHHLSFFLFRKWGGAMVFFIKMDVGWYEDLRLWDCDEIGHVW